MRYTSTAVVEVGTMPFRERCVMSLREEFVQRALAEDEPFRALCRRFEISAPTGYRWLVRYRREGLAGLADRSRRPRRSPRRTSPELEAAVLALRARHPSWGGRKLAARLRALGRTPVPAPSTITAILRRHDRLDPARAGRPRDFQRFEHEAPNELWQMDFKGHVPCGGGRCHPLTVLDDHSRYALTLAACADERGETVQDRLVETFRQHGLPQRLLVDNGSPWGAPGAVHGYTPLTIWLLRLGVQVVHSRPRHPQTLGKDERFHRTLNAELLGEPLPDLGTAQRRFDAWRRVYNHERPHEAIDDAVPASRYWPSERPYPEQLPPIEYPRGDELRKVQDGGRVDFQTRRLRVGKGFTGLQVAVRPLDAEDCWAIYFNATCIAKYNLATGERV
jgi:transposase InsO family protein